MIGRGRGFTLLETLVVMALIATLAAMLFPVLAEARRAAYKPACASNLGQIGVAIRLYQTDHDDAYPAALDAAERNDRCKADDPEHPDWPFLPDLLASYTRSRDVWRCPLDHGIPDRHGDWQEGSDCQLPGTAPSVFALYGDSYLYRSDLAEPTPAGTATVGEAAVALAWDLHGGWHGGTNDEEKRYTTLHADGHVALLDTHRLAEVRNRRPAP